MITTNEIEVWQHGIIRDGVLKPYNAELHKGVLEHFMDKEVEYCIRKKKKKATPESHAYYRGIVLPCAKQSQEFADWTLDDIHRYFAIKFLKDVEVKETKSGIRFKDVVLSSGQISIEMFWEFVTKVRIYLEEKHNIHTPEPDSDNKTKK